MKVGDLVKIKCFKDTVIGIITSADGTYYTGVRWPLIQTLGQPVGTIMADIWR
jgi:hypothetical protein